MVNVRVIVVAARGEPQIVRVVDESFIWQHGYEHSEFLEPVRPTNQVTGREMVDDNHCRFKRRQNGPIRFERLQFRLYSKLPEMMRDQYRHGQIASSIVDQQSYFFFGHIKLRQTKDRTAHADGCNLNIGLRHCKFGSPAGGENICGNSNWLPDEN